MRTLGDVGGVQPLRTALSLASLQVLLYGVDHGPLITGLPMYCVGQTVLGCVQKTKFIPLRVELCENPSRTPVTVSEFPGCH